MLAPRFALGWERDGLDPRDAKRALAPPSFCAVRQLPTAHTIAAASGPVPCDSTVSATVALAVAFVRRAQGCAFAFRDSSPQGPWGGSLRDHLRRASASGHEAARGFRYQAVPQCFFTVRHLLAHDRPVLFGAALFAPSDDPTAWPEGAMPFPDPDHEGATLRGGQAFVAVGYDNGGDEAFLLVANTGEGSAAPLRVPCSVAFNERFSASFWAIDPAEMVPPAVADDRALAAWRVEVREGGEVVLERRLFGEERPWRRSSSAMPTLVRLFMDGRAEAPAILVEEPTAAQPDVLRLGFAEEGAASPTAGHGYLLVTDWGDAVEML